MFRLHLTPGWTRFLYGIPEPVPPSRRGVPRPNRLYPTVAPKPVAAPRLRLGWRPWELAVLVSQLPPAYRASALDGLRRTLDFRARSEEPPKRPKDAPLDKVERTRFGLLGERLQDSIPDDLRKTLRVELREILWTLETVSLRLVRNYYLAMHSARLGQLAGELEGRAGNALEEIRSGLLPLWE
jgi:hypothetical protein